MIRLLAEVPLNVLPVSVVLKDYQQLTIYMRPVCKIRITAYLIFILWSNLLLAAPEYCHSQISRPTQLTYLIVQEFPHDPQAFTQGLAWNKGNVYEGTGLYGRSSLRRVDLHTGRVELQRNYDRQFFAEGITVYEDKIYQLTWKNNRIFQYDAHDFSLIGSWEFPYQGWGITHDNEQLIISDGTARLYFLEPKTLVEKRRIVVHDDQGQVNRLNELEYINGKIYANIWKTDQIAIIDPRDGLVTSYLNLSGLTTRMKGENNPGVPNGIMYDPAGNRLFVTGKLWPLLFEIQVVPIPL
jgi:glutaminyl-peptide cyclotransferase